MDTKIYQCLTYSYMSWGFISANIVLQNERLWQNCTQTREDTQIKLKQVCFPSSIWANSICPSYLRIIQKFFPIIRKKIRAALCICNCIFLTKHQHTCKRKALFLRTTFCTISSYLFKKLKIRQNRPRMVWLCQLK